MVARSRLLQHIRHDLHVYRISLWINIRAAAVLRGALITQIVGMVFNNACFLAAWLFFFGKFGTVNGWSAIDYIGLGALQSLLFGLVSFLVVGCMDIPRHVDSGSLDAFLTKPMSVLGNIASSNVDLTTIGDMIFGVVLLAWYVMHVHVGLAAMGMFMVAVLSAMIIFFCFAMLLPNVIAFYVFDSEKLSRYAGVLFLDSGLYPTGVLSGPLRAIFTFAIPAILFAAVPIKVLHGMEWQWVGIGAAVAIFWLIVTLWLFKRALRKYESANLIGAR